MPNPRSHYFHVEARFLEPPSGLFDVSLPVWTPGSYLVREYARHVINLSASANGETMPIVQRDKATWQIEVPHGADAVAFRYDVYAYELTVRTSYLDADYGLAHGTTLFLYHPEWKDRPVTLTLDLPDDWSVASGLDGERVLSAPNYDALVDCPIQMGRRLVRYPFSAGGVPHTLSVAGLGADQLPRPTFLEDLTRIIETAQSIFGSLPYSHYEFLVTVNEAGGGGLEHRNSANIMVPPSRWRNPRDYRALLSLFAHEFFHLWNVKRLHPTVLGPFDYQHEVYTSLLWALEGITDYMAPWLLAKSQTIPATEILDHWAKQIATLESQPGRWLTSLADASRQAWIRQYRPDANTPNITISYYLKGALAGLFLDLEMLQATDGEKTLTDVFSELWRRYGEGGYPEDAFEALLVEMGGAPLQRALARYVHGTEPFDESLFDIVGLRLERGFQDAEDRRPVWLGFWVTDRQGKLLVRQVERGGPGEEAGISPDDEILALNGERIRTAEQFNERLTQLAPGQSVDVLLAHQGRVLSRPQAALPPRPDRYQLVPVADASLAQRERFERWLGVPLPQDA
ncbi:M61 family metallopeptidase [Sulfobacillus sp. DSM 109850]|uniref:M61 family metallopeptidase n=1 Tax=Sulfobacillus harzensis TaxID=2729629 RepID=A0A7Y0L6J9_9FIRM|nr:M61 family metallopeptidase [Sulfobacillus harzensis]